jgi:hypothetical protein
VHMRQKKYFLLDAGALSTVSCFAELDLQVLQSSFWCSFSLSFVAKKSPHPHWKECPCWLV